MSCLGVGVQYTIEKAEREFTLDLLVTGNTAEQMLSDKSSIDRPSNSSQLDS